MLLFFAFYCYNKNNELLISHKDYFNESACNQKWIISTKIVVQCFFSSSEGLLQLPKDQRKGKKLEFQCKCKLRKRIVTWAALHSIRCKMSSPRKKSAESWWFCIVESKRKAKTSISNNIIRIFIKQGK